MWVLCKIGSVGVVFDQADHIVIFISEAVYNCLM